MAVAIVLAGGQKTLGIKGLPTGRGAANEALIPIGEHYMIEYVIEALQKSSFIREIVIAGPVEELKKVFAQIPGLTIVGYGKTPIESFRKAREAVLTDDEFILIVTADVPLLTTQAVNDFLSSCLEREGDLFYPIVSKETNESKYPGVRRTYVNLKEGVFTGGNLILIRSGVVDRCLPVAEQLVSLRKKPAQLASYIGWNILARYLCGRLSIRDAEREISRLMGVKAVGFISSYAEIGIDVDKESDLALVKKVLCS